MNSNDLGPVIDRIYEAAARPELWRPVLNEMSVAVQAQGVQMLNHGPDGASLHAASEGLDEVLKAFFAEGWHRNNPREVKARMRGVTAGDVLTDRDLFTAEELDKEPWQYDFLDRFGLRWFCSFGLRPVVELAPFFLTIERLAKSDPFSDAEVEMIGSMVPHIRRAVRLSTALGSAAQTGMMDALTALEQPAMLLDTSGKVVGFNAAAEGLIGDGIALLHSRLHASNRPADALLQQLIDNVCWPGAACEAPAIDAIALPRAVGRPLIVQAAPLVNSARDLFQQARALLLFNPLGRVAEPNGDLLRFAFNLTATEAKTAQAFATVGSFEQVASRLNIKLGTVRSHMKAIFTKTDTHSQSALAVLLFRLSNRIGG